jgi:GrpB-like predicted nucleotidyltransferase (UPF0157 family)/predicted nucleotidyltransferase
MEEVVGRRSILGTIERGGWRRSGRNRRETGESARGKDVAAPTARAGGPSTPAGGPFGEEPRPVPRLMETLKQPADEPVRVVPYNPAWPARFEDEKLTLEKAIAPWVTGGIHHVGSTAVPGLAAKPIIDILVGVEDLASSRACFEALGRLDYKYAPYRSDEMHWFCKPDPEHRTHHLHLVPTGSRRYRAELAFRDELRTRADLAGQYQALKESLAQQHRDDREAYTEAKQDFVTEIVALHDRRTEVEAIATTMADWARSQPGIAGVAMVGSWARNAARIDSDVDLIMLVGEPSDSATSSSWLGALGSPPVVRRQRWGVVTETRARLESGLEVEMGIAAPTWAATDPVDPGTRRVIEGGLKILFDQRGLFESLAGAIAASSGAR